ncbi:MAG: DUF2795 domain-containing protein [Salinigranum sp.]
MRLNGTGDAIDSHEYPATSEELIEAYGEHLIELQDGSESVADVLGRVGSETYQRPEEVYETLFGAVGHEAVGRRYYSDRDQLTIAEDGPTPLSF